MPKKYGKRKRGKRGKKTLRRKRRMTNYVPRGPVAAKTVVGLKYNFQGFSSAVAQDNNIIRLNSTFDPELTAGGHQPYGRDTYASLYNRYLVRKVHATMRFFITGAVSSPYLVTLVPNNDGSAITSAFNPEFPDAISFPLTIAKPMTIRKTFYPNKVTGVTTTKYRADDVYQALVGTDPSELIVLHTIVTDGLGVAVTGVVMNYTLTYVTEFFDPVVIGTS